MDCPFAVRVEMAVHCRGGGRPAGVGRYDSFGRTRMVLAAGHAGGLGPILPRLAGILGGKRCSLVPQVIFREGFQQASPLGELDNP